MNVLSLFDGMSCGQIALNKAGIKYDNYFASEIDKYAIQVAKDNFPGTVHLGDVTKIDFKSLPKIDLLIGGSPCQGFSFAGKQLNFKDPRSALFFEYVRALKELKPKWFLLENVVMKKESEKVISEYLGAEPVLINSSFFSAQNRKRLYWTNIKINKYEDKNIKLKDIVLNDAIPVSLHNLYGGFKDWDVIRKFHVTECKRLQTVPDDYVMNVSDTQAYKMLGNGWTVDVIAHIFQNLTENNVIAARQVGRKIINGKRADDKNVKSVQRIEINKDPNKTNCLTGTAKDNILIFSQGEIRKLNVLECKRLQTVSDDYIMNVSNSQAYKMLGNGWTVDVIAHIFQNLT